MQTLKTIKQLVARIKYKDWEFRIIAKDKNTILIQPQFKGADSDTGKIELQRCRKWYISKYMCDSEIIRTCFLAIQQAEEHELCEHFKFDGQAIYTPHLNLKTMADSIKHFNPNMIIEVRKEIKNKRKK